MRKVIQIFMYNDALIALCDDSTIWEYMDGEEWQLLKLQVPGTAAWALNEENITEVDLTKLEWKEDNNE